MIDYPQKLIVISSSNSVKQINQNNYLKVCDPAAAFAAPPLNPPAPGKPNCGAALAAQTTANNTMKNFMLNFTVYDQ